jgi:hypothetical protein
MTAYKANKKQIGLESEHQTIRREKMAERIYIVRNTHGARLVRANLRQQALSHVASTEYTVSVASQDDLVEQITAGTPVEQYKAVDLVEDSESPGN